MISGKPTGRTGMMAGAFAMLAALLAMELISRLIAPWQLLTEYLSFIVFTETSGLTGEFAWWLRGGGPNFSRIVMFLIIIFLLVGAGLGRWANANKDVLWQRAMQAAATILFVTLVLVYLADSRNLEFFLQEIAITLALSCLVYAFMLNWLLQESNNENRWRIGGVIAFVGLAVIVGDVYFL